jgi:hypothetical protein
MINRVFSLIPSNIPLTDVVPFISTIFRSLLLRRNNWYIQKHNLNSQIIDVCEKESMQMSRKIILTQKTECCICKTVIHGNEDVCLGIDNTVFHFSCYYNGSGGGKFLFGNNFSNEKVMESFSVSSSLGIFSGSNRVFENKVEKFSPNTKIPDNKDNFQYGTLQKILSETDIMNNMDEKFQFPFY